MTIYITAISVIAGICLGYAILHFFTGIRAPRKRTLNLTFAAFALGYGGTLLLGTWYRSQTSVEAFQSISRWDGIFIWLAFVGLNWYVETYTGLRTRRYLWTFTAIFSIAIIGAMLSPEVIYSTTPQLLEIPLPWNETVNGLEGEENIWGTLLLVGQLSTLMFIIISGIRQWRRGDRGAAAVLLLGMAWFIVALFYEILAEVGLWPYIPLAETGFIGIAIALSLQMANSVIQTEKALAASEKNLERTVAQRTAELEAAQEMIIEKVQEAAVSAERSRLARELHDVVTQILFSINLIAMSLPRLWKRDPVMAESSTNELQRLTRGALAEMRILLRELRPQTIIATDMGTLLTQLSHSISARHDIPGTVEVDENCTFPPDVHVAFYRIAQEALNNITKHAEASAISITLSCNEEEVTLIIRDDGHGFDSEKVPGMHMGLDIMRERAINIGAHLALNSRQDAGTMITLTWAPPEWDTNTDREDSKKGGKKVVEK